METQKTLNRKQYQERTELEESHSLTSECTTKLTQKQTHRSMEQDRGPSTKPTHLRSIIYDKGGKNIQWRKDSLFNMQF